MTALNQKEKIDVEVKLPCDAQLLKYIRKLVCEIASDIGFSEKDVSHIEISVDEACTNAIKHAYSCDISRVSSPVKGKTPERRLIISVNALPEKMCISVCDYGIGLKSGNIGIKDIDEYLKKKRQSGLGIYLIRKFMDEVDLSSAKGSGTVISMTKYKPRS